jgi:indole-3-glycerol phosphate synthase
MTAVIAEIKRPVQQRVLRADFIPADIAQAMPRVMAGLIPR